MSHQDFKHKLKNSNGQSFTTSEKKHCQFHTGKTAVKDRYVWQKVTPSITRILTIIRQRLITTLILFFYYVIVQKLD